MFASIEARTVARVLAPAAMAVLLVAHTAAACIYYRTHTFNAARMVLSDFESPDDNPQGYWLAAAGTAVACALLFPAAPLFRRSLGPSLWAGVGAWIYGGGSLSGIAMAALEPLLNPFHPLHILLAFMTFLGLTGGLACVSIAAARARQRPGGAFWYGAATVYVTGVLMALDVIPLPERGSLGFLNSLAAGEIALIVLIGAGTWALAAANALPATSERSPSP